MANRGFLLIINAANNEDQRNRNRLTRKHLRDVSDPLDMPESQFHRIYRLSRRTIVAALHFFSQGNYLKAVGQDYFTSMSQSSASRCIAAVNTALESMYYRIHFPSNEEERNAFKQGYTLFMEMPNGFPGIVGAVDGTQVAIIAPPINDNFPPLVFYNRKGFYSLNVQIIFDSRLNILAINVRFPGSVHDSTIWATSQIRRLLENNYATGDHGCWLLGDSGYPLEP
ncbi:hypothetical protein NQ315_013472 [Exocentrus adspersus]|uniref:DDE Tnp4 domain-containing protein n=1 Tax=Exocentrus adspersus TaxID=1586481 RepID=A0AAV8VDM1_9CUCU|nr:hypothetical protein NQ315_013472 [Exocentrus adspersus]